MYKKSVLGNGVVIATEELPYANSLALAVWLKVGSRDESKAEEGLSHFSEHMVFKGTAQKTAHEIARELDSIGGISDAITGKESICFYVKLLPKHFYKARDIMLDILLNPRFDPVDLEFERQVVLQELNMIKDSPEDYIYDLLCKAIFGEHPLGRPVIGSREAVGLLNRESLLCFWEERLYGRNILISVSGKISHQEIMDSFSPALEHIKTNGHSSIRTQPSPVNKWEFLERDLAQVHLAMGYEAPPLNHGMRMPCAILNCILGGTMSSRLFQKVREQEGLVYSVYSSYAPYSDTGILSIYFAAEKEDINRVLRIVKEENLTLIHQGPTEEELLNAKEYLLASIYLGSETPESKMFRNAKAEMHLGRYVSLEELEGLINRVSKSEVQEAAKRVLGTYPPALAVIGPMSHEEIQEDI